MDYEKVNIYDYADMSKEEQHKYLEWLKKNKKEYSGISEEELEYRRFFA